MVASRFVRIVLVRCFNKPMIIVNKTYDNYIH